MNKTERNELSYFPHALDDAIEEKFGVTAKSSWNFFSGKHTTDFDSEDPVLCAEIKLFIDGFIAGNQELCQRLTNLK